MKVATIDVESVLSQLTTNEKISLLSGSSFWHTTAIPRLGIPSLRMCDGPNGIRGVQHFNAVPASCLPCGTALGATWDQELVAAAGRLMGDEARVKGVHILLGPTVNIQRSPLGGRGFESYSEDPVLSGTLAAAQIRGTQSRSLAATIKHFVCNDLEHERKAVNVMVSERALREIYLLPFQIVLQESDPWALMTSYNKVNGIHASEDPKLLKQILYDEWGYRGMLMSNWFGTYSTSGAIKAGLDLEMPGPSTWRGFALRQALRCNKVTIDDVDARVRSVLRLVKHAVESGVPEMSLTEVGDVAAAMPVLRKLASSSIVLLKNEGRILPFQKDKKVAVIRPNVKIAVIHGGGSAIVTPSYAISPYEGIKRQVSSTLTYAKGADAHKQLPPMNGLLRTPSGKAGFLMKFYTEPPTSASRRLVDEVETDDTMVYLTDYRHELIADFLYYADLVAFFEPDVTGEYNFGLPVYGTGKLYVDGKMVVDNASRQTPGDSFWGAGTREEQGTIFLEAGRAYEIKVEFGTAPTQTKGGAWVYEHGRRWVAKAADQVVICVGLSEKWESEGFDRKDMDLPGFSDELTRRVASANLNTAVVIQSGTPVRMPWVDQVPAIIQAWYGGNEAGNAIADVLFGDVNPSGKLPLRFPVHLEDNPAFLKTIEYSCINCKRSQ
ncbi:Beta-glucosidase I [Pleurostoma richardsiae]|uniref:Probable beta-glucosidase I n=1 Tax=Pleurostoma richardsiae TaxID=41990 RepID=A0AA38W0H2_9PEZI|nr:Beta-glucosidase I [Pleurostoma richardsiae]